MTTPVHQRSNARVSISEEGGARFPVVGTDPSSEKHHDFSIEHPSWTGGYGFYEPFAWECAKCGGYTSDPDLGVVCPGESA